MTVQRSKTFSIVTVLVSFNLNLKFSLNWLVMLLYFMPESLAAAMFYLLFLLRNIIISGDVMHLSRLCLIKL